MHSLRELENTQVCGRNRRMANKFTLFIKSLSAYTEVREYKSSRSDQKFKSSKSDQKFKSSEGGLNKEQNEILISCFRTLILIEIFLISHNTHKTIK